MEEKNLIEIIDDYISFLDLKEITIKSYKKILYDYYEFISKITNLPNRADILKYKEDLKKRAKSATIQKYIVVLRNFYRWFHIQGYGANIAEGIKGAKIEATFKKEALSIKDARKLLLKAEQLSKKSIIDKRNYAIVALIMTTGLRTIEIERSDVGDIDLVEGNNVLYIMGKGHDDKDSFVKLSSETYDIIIDYLKDRNDNFEPLFINHSKQLYGTRIQTKTIRTTIKELLRRIGIDSKKYSAHSLRHTAATINLLSGASLEETQQLLRHKDISTTTIYSHHMNRSKNNSEFRVSDVLFNKKKGN